MGCGSLLPSVTKRVTTQSTTTVYEPFVEWVPAMGLDSVKGAILLRAVAIASGTFNAQLAIQTAEVRTDAPGAWALVNGLSTTAANGTPADANAAVISIASLTAGKAWVRFGVAVSGSVAPAAADVTLVLSYAQCGSMVGTWRGQLQTSSTNESHVAVTPWLPAISADKIEGAFLVASTGAHFTTRLCVRWAASTTAAPGPWSAVGPAAVAGASERNSGEVTLSAGTNMFVQAGLAYASDDGSFAEGDVVLSIGVRKT